MVIKLPTQTMHSFLGQISLKIHPKYIFFAASLGSLPQKMGALFFMTIHIPKPGKTPTLMLGRLPGTNGSLTNTDPQRRHRRVKRPPSYGPSHHRPQEPSEFQDPSHGSFGGCLGRLQQFLEALKVCMWEVLATGSSQPTKPMVRAMV